MSELEDEHNLTGPSDDLPDDSHDEHSGEQSEAPGSTKDKLRRTPTHVIADEDLRLTPDEIIQQKTSRACRDLSDFIRIGNFTREKGSQVANICDRAVSKIYEIDHIQMEDFFTLIDRCRQEGAVLQWQERQAVADNPHSGIMIDFDFYQPTRNVQVLPRHMDALMREIGLLIAQSIDFSPYISEDNPYFTFHAFVIRKPDVVPATAPHQTAAGPSKPEFKDGWHILIPEIQTIKGYKQWLVTQLSNEERLKKVFRGAQSNYEYARACDMGSVRNPVYYYGCGKAGKPTYVLRNAYEITIDASDATNVERRQLLLGDITGRTDINLTYEMSLASNFTELNGRPTWLKKHKFSYLPAIEFAVQQYAEKYSRKVADEDIEDNAADVSLLSAMDARAAQLSKMLDILDPQYALDYNLWFKVICAIAHTNHAYKPLAKAFSLRRPDSFSQASFDAKWNEAMQSRSGKAPVTLRSILYWAKTSSPDRYREIHKADYVTELTTMAYKFDGEVEQAKFADIVYKLACGKFVVDVAFNKNAGKRQYTWYEFMTPDDQSIKGEVWKWRQEFKPDGIHLLCTRQLENIALDVANYIKDRSETETDPIKMKYHIAVYKKFKQKISKLSNNIFQRGIVEQAEFRFRFGNRGFADELDSYEDVIGVGNGVLVLGHQPRLIKGFHDYKVSKYTPTDYIPYDPTDPLTRQLEQAIHDVLIEQDVYEFILMYASTGMDNCKSANLFLELYGDGSDGKTFILDMLRNTLGPQYCLSAKPALLTSGAERAGQTNSSLYSLKGMRFFTVEEFNAGDSYNEACLKSVTDGVVVCRGVYRTDEEQFNLRCNGIGATNHIINVNSQDHGFWRRILHYNTKNKFVPNPDPTNPYERKVDYAYRSTYVFDPIWQQKFLSILVHWNVILRTKYGNDVNNIPIPTIRRESAEHRMRMDALDNYIANTFVYSPEADPISLDTVAGKYREYFIKNIRHTNLALDRFIDMIAQSRLRKHIASDRRGIKMLSCHRMRMSADEPLGPGEQDLKMRDIGDIGYNMNVSAEVTPCAPVVGEDKKEADDVFGQLPPTYQGGSPDVASEIPDIMVEILQ